MNGLKEPFIQNSDPKNRKKTVKITVKWPRVKKSLAGKRIFVQKPLYLSTLKLGKKSSRRKTSRFFEPFPVSA